MEQWRCLTVLKIARANWSWQVRIGLQDWQTIQDPERLPAPDAAHMLPGTSEPIADLRALLQSWRRSPIQLAVLTAKLLSKDEARRIASMMHLGSGVKQALGRLFPRWRDFRRSRASYRIHFGHSPRFLFAKTFNEKIQRYKILGRDPRMPLRADKVLVKDFVTEKLGPGWTTPTLWHGAALPPLHERIWPLPFVIKANHGSSMNIFVRSANDLDWPRIETLCANWLSASYGASTAEWVYYKIERQLLVEPFIAGGASLPTDYKFWTFHGRVEFIQVDTDREHRHKRAMFDREWRPLPFNVLYPSEQRHIDRPQSLKRMMAAAETLSEGMPFVRADFYEIDGTPRFGEMTFYPEAGLGSFNPPEYDASVGALWR